MGSGTEDADPFVTNVCDTERGRCVVDGTECVVDADCPASDHTGNNVCNGEDCTTEDAHVICWLEADDLPGDEICDLQSFSCSNIPDQACQSDGDCIPITDVCSYPSQQPNSDPSDCIITPTGQSPCTDSQGQLYDCSNSDTACATASCDPFGAEANCDILAPVNVGTLCRAGSGDICDPDEECDGVNSECPADVVAPATTVCNAGSGDLCDPDESCTGVADAACPADVVAPATTICNPGSGDICDPDESCTGVAGDACPADNIASATTICRAGSGDLCDPDESCTGEADAACPADVVAPATTICNPGSGDICDPDESCTG
ncbi:MAG: hypothetical protein GTO30_16765, partial [Acidobacteria bacterium]|nr:hypothetical protein [Acidobacteriota bacterium]NIM63224.1 hypothetical protein [Acidobacteriota bacterium]NIO61002.1 hypothetical protein [Acidobacteriota bacterium]NIQ87511.1 hypothetical protein [Acidobacteriota bacterium]NIT12639.1 hypothetical protein [Acidobacteriota bacterium]